MIPGMLKGSNAGGRRQGSGAPPGELAHRLLTAPPPPELPDTLPNSQMLPLSDLPPRVQSALRWSARGFSGRKIAQLLECDSHSITRWLRGYPAAIQEAVRELTDPHEAIRHMLPDALRALHDCLNSSDDPAVRLAAARDLLDRLYGKPIVRSETSVRAAHIIRIIDGPE